MDMNLHRGDWIYEKTEGLDDYFTTHYVVVEDILIVDGVRRKWLTIDSGVDCLEYSYFMVEGIGLNMDYFVDMGLGDWSRYYHRLSACYDNGKCIFSEEDFDRDKLTGITDTPKTDGTSTPLYDMQGMKRNDIRKGEVYIQNGKKHVRR